jgi:SAM-dependent methyltransferase
MSTAGGQPGRPSKSENQWEGYWADEEHHGSWERPAPEVIDLIGTQSPDERPDVLDLGCGLGRHAIVFAQAGFRVTATDRSETAVAHLRDWAGKLGLSLITKVCSVLDEIAPPASFDIVLSYNVIYHGRREEFAQAIAHVRALLRPGGLFFFTCPTREDGKYGYGEEVAPHTFRCTKSITPGDIHYFSDEADLDELLRGYRIVSQGRDEQYWDNEGVRQFGSNWLVLAERPRDQE